MPDKRAASADRINALELAFRGFAERKGDAVVVPSLGLTFDSLGEAYDYCNLYSSECGFGIRYRKSRTNVKGAKSIQELLCNCGVIKQSIYCLVIYIFFRIFSAY